MHIPDGFLTPQVWGTTDLLSGAILAYGLRRVGRHVEEREIPLMGVLAAFVFAAQMFNLPISGGTSAHFLGGTLLAVLLGPWAGLIVLTVVLVVQCFIFQDGGVAALGANIMTMGVVGCLGGGSLFFWLRRSLPGNRSLFWSGVLAAGLSITMSALLCAGFLCFSGVAPWRLGLSVIGGTHLVLGGLEGLVTGTILESLQRRRPDLLERPRI